MVCITIIHFIYYCVYIRFGCAKGYSLQSCVMYVYRLELLYLTQLQIVVEVTYVCVAS